VADRAARLRPPADVRLKDPSGFHLIGKPVHRIDTPDKAAGETVYGIDVMRPGMKYATLMSSPVLGGKVGSVDQSKALSVPGVRQVVVLEARLGQLSVKTALLSMSCRRGGGS
jgi:isoquinoline 1-oxidoreductase beta subunit